MSEQPLPNHSSPNQGEITEEEGGAANVCAARGREIVSLHSLSMSGGSDRSSYSSGGERRRRQLCHSDGQPRGYPRQKLRRRIDGNLDRRRMKRARKKNRGRGSAGGDSEEASEAVAEDAEPEKVEEKVKWRWRRRILQSLDSRQLSKDGRLRKFDEKPLVVVERPILSEDEVVKTKVKETPKVEPAPLDHKVFGKAKSGKNHKEETKDARRRPSRNMNKRPLQ